MLCGVRVVFQSGTVYGSGHLGIETVFLAVCAVLDIGCFVAGVSFFLCVFGMFFGMMRILLLAFLCPV